MLSERMTFELTASMTMAVIMHRPMSEMLNVREYITPTNVLR